jgi:hypothetical protein
MITGVVNSDLYNILRTPKRGERISIMNMNSSSEKRILSFHKAMCHALNEAESIVVFFTEEIYEFQTHTHSPSDRSFV